MTTPAPSALSQRASKSPPTPEVRLERLRREQAAARDEEVENARALRLFTWSAVGLFVASPLGAIWTAWITFGGIVTALFIVLVSRYLGYIYTRDAVITQRALGEKIAALEAELARSSTASASPPG